MKKLLLCGALIGALTGYSQQSFKTIWEENFNNYQIPSGIEGESDDGATGTTNKWLYMGDYKESFTKWTIDASNASLQNFSDYAAVFRTRDYLDPHFRVQDTHGSEIKTPEGGHINWVTETIDISGFTNVSVSMSIDETGDHETSDYINVSYSTDNGMNYTLIKNWKGFGSDIHTLQGDTINDEFCNTSDKDGDFKFQKVYFSIPNSSNSLKIKVTFKNGASSENFILDDVKVFGKQSTLKVDEDSLDVVSIYPNPITGNQQLTINTQETIKSISIYDVRGQLVIEKRKVGTPNNQVSLSNISKGIYLIKVKTSTSEQVNKLVIQ
ncbi:Por_Secre_tail domain-containing protein [Tenacibaculum sp. 190524A02b]|uniref:Por_Secre_tail domain-containing protein n=1 Tax=Tenacibaculum vairaonense TaxID=3137860 RepID=A0ABP1FD51_9FLAO